MAKYAEKIVRVGVKREPGYFYFIDSDGDISRSPMGRTGRKKKVQA